MARIACVLLLLFGVAAAEQQLTLEFKDGTKRSLTVTNFDEKGLTVRKGSATERIEWSKLIDRAAFEARQALTPYDDAAARLALSEFARQRQLFPEALEELEVALALGAVDEVTFEKRAREIERAEVDYLCHRIDLLTKGGIKDPAPCLTAIKRLRERYPEHPNNRIYEPRIKELVELLAQAAEQEQADRKKLAESTELAALRKKLEKFNQRKYRAIEKAEKLREESIEAIEKRQVSRVKRKLVEPQGAEKYYKQARKYLREMARTDKNFQVVSEAGLQKEYDEIADRLVLCYLEVSRILIRERNYKGTIPYLRKILYYDPIHEEALEMVETIRKNRINFKASDITNARPRVTGG